MRVKVKKINLFLFLFLGSVYSCKDVEVPKPRGYFRIDLPKKEYRTYDKNSSETTHTPFTFEYPVYGNLTFEKDNGDDNGWFNIEFPSYKAKIYLTYKEINGDFDKLMEQTYTMNVKNHITKADAINEIIINNENAKVYGVLYDLKGNTASAVQFYITDSIYNYLRGSLYFSAEPNADSLLPVINFFREDIVHLIETLKWVNK